MERVMGMTPELKAQLAALPKGHVIRAGFLDGDAGLWVKVADYATSPWMVVESDIEDRLIADTRDLTDVVIPEITWPPNPLPTAPGTVIVARVLPKDAGLEPPHVNVSLIRTDRSDGCEWLAGVHVANSRYVRGDEITDWRVVYTPGGDS